jgi:hypothetical protein
MLKGVPLWLPQTTLLAPYTTGECSVAHSARDQRLQLLWSTAGVMGITVFDKS